MSQQSILKNIVRTGWVSSINKDAGTARVIFRDKGQEIVSGDLKIIQNPPRISETVEGSVTAHHWMPHIDQYVLCLYIPMEDGDGFILGGI